MRRARVAPSLGKMDIDYNVLYDAFFKHQTKPPLKHIAHGPGAQLRNAIVPRDCDARERETDEGVTAKVWPILNPA